MDLLLKRRRIIASQRGEDTTDYTLLPLTFKCLTGGDLSIKNANGSFDRNFEYSINGGAWTVFDLPKNTASKLITTLSPNDTISFRRDGDNFADAQFIIDSNLTFDIYGNLLSLQYGSAFNGQTELRNTSKKAFGALFSGTNVVDASNLMLTATTLSNNCYFGMFSNCTGLINAPELPATTIAGSCYVEMFKNCSSLVRVPNKLPATTLKDNCYKDMFQDCTSLIDAPELPATTLAKSCYQSMFKGCTNLIACPELQATTLADSCYNGMFYNCTSLTIAPELPAKTLAVGCYSSMFRGCTNLVTIPTELPATTLQKDCYSYMFESCKNITSAPILPAETLVTNCYSRMFNLCNKLSYVKCLATNNSSDFNYAWLNEVSPIGTFVKKANSSWQTGTAGIPNNWTVIEE